MYKASNPDVCSYLNRLNGSKHLVIGNHDEKMIARKENRKYFKSISRIAEVYDGDKRIILCHYPMMEWAGFYRGSYHFYGHVHANEKNLTTRLMKEIPRAYNVGVDVIGYTPLTADQIIRKDEE